MKIRDNKIYDIGQVLETINSNEYFGMSFAEIKKLFSNYTNMIIVDELKIEKHIKENPMLQPENKKLFTLDVETGKGNTLNVGIYKGKTSAVIAEKRLKDYKQYRHRLSILVNKGKQYLSLINYIANIPTQGKMTFMS